MTMKSKTSAFLTLAGSMVASVCASDEVLAAKRPAPERSNILLILVDDMGCKDTGFTGSDFYETPILDSLARLSMRFNNAYSCAGNSAPSRACLISGQFTPRHGVYAVYHTKRGPEEQMRLEPYPNTHNLPLECYTIAEAMRDAGYATGMVGKWHLGGEQHRPVDQGFQLGYEDKIPDKSEFLQTNDPKNIFKEVAMICDFMEKSVKEKTPFFAYLPFHAVHQAWQARQEYIDYFNRKPAGQRHDNALYAALVKHVDDAVGILNNKLKELGVDKNTVIIFTSDNGGLPQTTQEPLRGFKGCLYEGGIRVPFFIHNAEMIAPGVTDYPVANVDFFPTCLDFAGVKAPKDKILDGVSLKPLVTGEGKQVERTPLFWHFPCYLDKPCRGSRDKYFRQRPSTVMRKGDWKLTLYYEEWMLDGGWEKRDENHCVELYNLKEDVSEQHDLANVNKAKRDELLKEMLRWLEKNDVAMPTLKQN